MNKKDRKIETYTISLPKQLKEKAEKKAFNKGKTFSGMIRYLLQKELEDKKNGGR